MLLKQQFTMVPDDAPVLAGGRFFKPADGDPAQYLTMEDDDWVEMGSPPIITITIEPGDKLNEKKEQ